MKLKNLIECLQIAERHCRPGGVAHCTAEHDIMFLPIDRAVEMSDEDRARLLELGAHISSESDTWAVFT